MVVAVLNGDSHNPYNIVAFAGLSLGALDIVMAARYLAAGVGSTHLRFALGLGVLGLLFSAIGWAMFRHKNADVKDFTAARFVIWSGLLASALGSYFSFP